VEHNKPEDIADPRHRHKLFNWQLSHQKISIITQAQSVIQQSTKGEARAKKRKKKTAKT
jgi:hypothetical protein